ncbi:MAG TPA: tripartite tricarboxylate transporter substrate binding protein [Pseudolabrys sp.]|nr:tripartite tricarboxylate transporter substrate binding protein [Pseudolabrys sp.]
MKLLRRQFLHLATGAALLPGLSQIAWAQSYPARPARIVVGFPAGTSSDITARLIADWLSGQLGQQVIVEDRPGAGTNIAAETVVQAAADGYSLLWVTQTNAINATLYQSLKFDFMRDIEPVAGVIRVPTVMMVNPSVPAKTVPEFIAYAKANPGKVNMSSPGIGSANHVLGEMFEMMTDTKLVHIPYKGSQFPDLLSGQVQVTFNPLPSSLNYIKTGQLRALAVTSATRQAVLPDVPTVGEFVPGYEGNAWFGVGAPKNTPKDIVDKLNRTINAGLADAKLKAKLIELGGVPMPVTPAEFGKFIAEETEKWAKVVKFAGLKVT